MQGIKISKGRKSVNGAAIFVGGILVNWIYKKQGSVALSTAEAEFVAAATAGQEAMGARGLLTEMKMAVEDPVAMLMDNQAAIRRVEKKTSPAKLKHVDEKLKFLRGLCTNGTVSPEYVSTEGMLADLMTKSLTAPRFE